MVEIERSLLKYILSSKENSITIFSEGIDKNYFSGIRGEIFNIILENTYKGIYLSIPLLRELTPQFNEEIISIENSTSVADTFSSLKILSERARLITLDSLLKTASDKIASSNNSIEIIQNLKSGLFKVEGSKQSPVEKIGDLLPTLETQYEFMPTEIYDLDSLIIGYSKGTFNVIASRPSVGKTLLLKQILLNVCRRNKTALLFSLEETREISFMKALSNFSGVNFTSILKRELTTGDLKKIEKVKGDFKELKFFVDSSGNLTPESLSMKIENFLLTKKELDIIGIDYLQLMRSSQRSSNRTEDMTNVSNSVKSISKNYNVPIIVLSQLNRAIDSSSDEDPLMSYLRDSGAIENDADTLLFLLNKHKKFSGTKREINCHLLKNRFGPIGQFSSVIDGSVQRFLNTKNTNDIF